jgi:deazaflavin-dependent oxidoreductase (nitroreductase family)
VASSEPTFVRERPNAFLKLFFKVPPLIYRGPIAELLRSRCVLRLTTTGRKSGLPRTICVSFSPLNGHYVIFSGFGIESQWYQNVQANPAVTVQVGRRAFAATAVPVADPARRRELMLMMRDRSANCGPPTWIRPLLRLTRTFDYDAEIRLAVEQAEALPVVELIPRQAG